MQISETECQNTGFLHQDFPVFQNSCSFSACLVLHIFLAVFLVKCVDTSKKFEFKLCATLVKINFCGKKNKNVQKYCLIQFFVCNVVF